jgi:lipopolysaccharide export system protein LptA
MKQIHKILFLSLFLVSISFALPEDSKEKIHIKAASAIYNYKSGINTFVGDVQVDQGTTHITADKLVTKSNKAHKIEEAIAYGFKTKAHYWTIPKKDDKELHAYAMIIKFYPQVSNVGLEQDVTITQGENSFNGQRIFYNMHDETITVPPLQNGRAVIVYNPDS